MIDSRRELVLANIASTLAALRIADGFDWDVQAGSVFRDPINLLTAQPGTALPLFQVEPSDRGRTEYQPALQIRHHFDVVITMRHDAEGIAPDRKSKLWEKLIANVETALSKDITRGGAAIDTLLGEPLPMVSIGADNMVVVVQPITVRIRRTYGKP